MGSPQKLKSGWRVSSTTTSSGTKNIRNVVKLFGRFISGSAKKSRAVISNSAGCRKYSLPPRQSQRHRPGVLPRAHISLSHNSPVNSELHTGYAVLLCKLAACCQLAGLSSGNQAAPPQKRLSYLELVSYGCMSQLQMRSGTPPLFHPGVKRHPFSTTFSTA